MIILERIAEAIGVSRVNDISRFDLLPLFVYQTCRPSAHHLCIDSGKNKCKKTAKIVALMEAIERYAAENISNPSCFVQPDAIELDLVGQSYSHYSDDFPIKCFTGFNIISGDPLYIPSDLIHYSLSNPSRLIHVFPSGTTGLGAHFNLDMAICSGLVEIIERDAIVNNDFQTIDPSSLSGATKVKLDLVCSKVGKYTIRVYKTPWPVYVFSVIGEDSSVNGGMIGFGLGFTAEDGLNDALDEAFQTWLMRISAARDDWAFSNLPIFNIDVDTPKTSFQKLDVSANSFVDLSIASTKLHEVNYNKLLNFASTSNINIYAVSIVTPTPISPVKVVKVIVPSSKQLRQGPMLTGFPILKKT